MLHSLGAENRANRVVVGLVRQRAVENFIIQTINNKANEPKRWHYDGINQTFFLGRVEVDRTEVEANHL